MTYFLLIISVLVVGCNTLKNDKKEIEKIIDDAVNEEIDTAVEGDK